MKNAGLTNYMMSASIGSVSRGGFKKISRDFTEWAGITRPYSRQKLYATVASGHHITLHKETGYKLKYCRSRKKSYAEIRFLAPLK